ncbi:MAG: YceH family protein [Acidobacteria bacterium]|nr:YceH family protein [Acidobacteriota bacterium]HMU34492.1 YceH family protein [Pyrinomonadaceae bacterium]
MLETLNEIEARVVGALVEKQLTTPEYYPLTLNALVSACNQKNNREPVMTLDADTVSAAVEHLRDRNLVYVFYGSTSRVPKYKHMLPSYYTLEPDETALLAVLMLRGPQTIGELRERTGRMHTFDGLGEVQEALDRLTRREEPLVTKLDRLPGRKEARFAHLLSGEITQEAFAAADQTVTSRVGTNGFGDLKGEIESLKSELAALQAEFAEFRKQFE